MGHVGGKLLLFQAGLPSLGPGKLKPSRDNLNLYNTEREAQLRNPEDPFFKRYAGEASSRQISLDVFLGTPGFADLASLAAIPRYTCGQVGMVHVWCGGRKGAGGGGETGRGSATGGWRGAPRRLLLHKLPTRCPVQVYHYPSFHAARDGPKLSAELRRNLTRPTAWEAVMRIRCSRGLKISSFHGHFFNRRCGLVAAAAHSGLCVCLGCGN
jgi:protein transport protein SEC24